MNDRSRAALRLKVELEWVKAKAAYEAAGAPFGDGRGLDVWIEYGQQTTVN